MRPSPRSCGNARCAGERPGCAEEPSFRPRGRRAPDSGPGRKPSPPARDGTGPGGPHPRRGRGAGRRRVPGHRRALGCLRPRPGHGHAPSGKRHRGHGYRAGPGRFQAYRGDPVHGLHVPGREPDFRPRRPLPEPLTRALPGAHGHPHALRRRHSSPRAPLRILRGHAGQHAGPESGCPLQPLRRQGPPPIGHPRRGPRDLPGAQTHLPRLPRGGAAGTLHGAPGPGQGREGGEGHLPHQLRLHGQAGP